MDSSNIKIKTYHVDAFTNKLFSGNPAVVCILDDWILDVSLQKIAAENNLDPETGLPLPASK